jgi:ABC-type antimicrobial peptide transport system permease subunit
MALMLAMIGIYGVMSFAVTQRAREMGIRMALGAQSGSVFGLLVREGIVPTALGATLGLVLSRSARQFRSRNARRG